MEWDDLDERDSFAVNIDLEAAKRTIVELLKAIGRTRSVRV